MDNKFYWNDDTIMYFAKQISDSEDVVINEMQRFIETDCEPTGEETYEMLFKDLFNQVKQAIKENYE
jgi:hypothetical protein